MFQNRKYFRGTLLQAGSGQPHLENQITKKKKKKLNTVKKNPGAKDLWISSFFATF